MILIIVVEKMRTNVIALEADEIDHHGKRFLAVRSVSILNAFGQVREESIAAFEHAETYQWLIAKVVEYLGC